MAFLFEMPNMPLEWTGLAIQAFARNSLPATQGQRWPTASTDRITLPLSGGQGALGGEEECWWWPVHSRGLFEGLTS
jgi:hypothetical protein